MATSKASHLYSDLASTQGHLHERPTVGPGPEGNAVVPGIVDGGLGHAAE